MKAYISGASGFLGQRIAKHFIAQGYSVTLSGKNLEKLEEIRKQLLNSAPQSNLLVEIHLLDFSKPEDISSELKCIDLDSFDWCVNAAGTQGTVSPDLNLTYADYTETLAVNLLSPIELTRYFSQHFLSRKKGKIIHFSGGGSANPRPFFSPYSISKTALARYVENTAMELLDKNIQIFLISPGLMPSEMLMNSQTKKEYLTPLEVASIDQVLAGAHNYEGQRILDLLDFLLSESGNFCTGKMISAQWDKWSEWPDHSTELASSDLYTLRRITGRDRGYDWGDL